MKKGLYILLGVAICFAILFALGTAIVFLRWAAIIFVVVAVIAVLLRAKWGAETEDASVSAKETRRIDKQANKTLKEMERKEAQRIRN